MKVSHHHTAEEEEGKEVQTEQFIRVRRLHFFLDLRAKKTPCKCGMLYFGSALKPKEVQLAELGWVRQQQHQQQRLDRFSGSVSVSPFRRREEEREKANQESNKLIANL